MTRKEKTEIRKRIGDALDIGNSRFSDDDAVRLSDVVKHQEQYDGETRVKKCPFDSWCSEGRYSGEETFTYTIRSNDGKMSIDEHYEYKDDDGVSRSSDRSYSKAREVLEILMDLFNNLLQ